MVHETVSPSPTEDGQLEAGESYETECRQFDRLPAITHERFRQRSKRGETIRRAPCLPPVETNIRVCNVL